MLLNVNIQFSHHHSLKKSLSFLHWAFLALLSDISNHIMRGFISGFLILCHCSVCLLLFWDHAVLISIALQCNLKLRRVVLLTRFFFLRTPLPIKHLLWFQTNFRICFLFLKKKKRATGILIRAALTQYMT